MATPYIPTIACLLLTLAAWPGLAASPKQEAKKTKTAYGAIAWHRDSGSYGYSYDLATARAAGIEALRQCGHPRCEVTLALRNECGAIAEGAAASKAGSKVFAARKGLTQAEAESKALSACGPNCRPVAWACTR